MKFKNSIMMSDWHVYVKVVESGSFSVAAGQVGRSISSVSKIVSKIESELGFQLINRSAHMFVLTPEGDAVYDNAKVILQTYHDLTADVKAAESVIQGVLRLSAPGILCDEIMPGWIREYTTLNPGARINLHSREGDSFSSGSPEFDDLVIKSGYMQSPDLVHKRLKAVNFGIYASPGYIAKRRLSHPEHLSDFRILKLHHPSLNGCIDLSNKSENFSMELPSSVHFTSNNVNSLLNMAIAGEGVCFAVPKWASKKHVENGLLSELLQEWKLPELPSFIVWRYRRSYSLLFRDFISFLEGKWNSLFGEE